MEVDPVAIRDGEPQREAIFLPAFAVRTVADFVPTLNQKPSRTVTSGKGKDRLLWLGKSAP